MRKVLVIFNLLLIFLSITATLNSAEVEKEPQLSYSKAVACLENLDMSMAYKRLDIITRDFPNSVEARRAVLLKAIISATEFSNFDMLSARYSEAVQKAKTDNNKREISKLYMETSQKMVESGKTLTNDVQSLLKYTDKPLNLEIKKTYNSLAISSEAFLPLKKLDEGDFPTPEEIEIIENFQKDISYRHVLGKVLGEEDLTTEKAIKGEVDWAGTMMLMGNWLVHCGGINKAGWIDPSTQKMTKSLVQAEKSFDVAKQCFEKAKKVSKDQQVKTQADARIKEINQILK